MDGEGVGEPPRNKCLSELPLDSYECCGDVYIVVLVGVFATVVLLISIILACFTLLVS